MSAPCSPDWLSAADAQPCRSGRWYQCLARPEAGDGYGVIEILPCNRSGDIVGDVVHLPLRPRRAGRRVVYTPPGCEQLQFRWLRRDDERSTQERVAVDLKPLGFLGAGWRLYERLAHFVPSLGTAQTLLLRLRCLFFPATCYAGYEQTLHYRSRSAVSVPATSERCASHWQELARLAPGEWDRALELGDNDWVVFQDVGDRWLQGGLEALRQWQAAHPDAGLITFDEQQVTEDTGAAQPWLKPQWNRDFFLSGAYQGHSVAVRGDLAARFLPGLAEGSSESADALVDALLLSMLAHDCEQFDSLVTHCPVLALQVVKPDMTNYPNTRKPCLEARSKQLAASFNTAVTVVRGAGRLGVGWRLHWPLPKPVPKVSICIPTRNGLAVLKPCLDAILEHTLYPNFEVLVVDNQSDCAATLDYLAQLQTRDKRVRVLRYDRPFNFSAINNFAVEQASGDLVGLINNDIEPRHPEWLTEMVAQAMRPGIGCVGARLYYPNGRIQHAGVVLGIGGVAGHAFRFEPGEAQGYQGRLQLAQNYSAVTAACMLIRKSLYKEVGGFDEQLAVNYNDVDFCLKLRAQGYRNVWTPHAELTHHESFTRGGTPNRQKRKRADREFQLMRKRWGAALDTDPAYHPLLTRVHEDFSLAVEEAAGDGRDDWLA